MKHKFSTLIWTGSLFLFIACSPTSTKQEVTLKAAFDNIFYIGTALNADQITGKDTATIRIIKTHFNSIVAENCMKSENIHPEEGLYDFALADQFVEFGERNKMFIVGHALIWHSQLSPWFCVDENGENVSKEVLKTRMKEHIANIVGRYKGRIKGWDVVNEAIMEDGSYRNSKFYEILGEEFIPLAFQYAFEADPDAELYYNDYNEWYPGKREAIVRMIRSLKEKGIRIDAIGMQGHVGMDGPSLEEYEAAIVDYAGEGVKVMVTEFDLSILPTPKAGVGADIAENFKYRSELDPYVDGVPDSVQEKWDERMLGFFGLFLKHADKVSRVTLWGISDKDSWKNNFPVYGRTDYPLLFDRDLQAKQVVNEIINIAQSKKK